MAFNDFISRGNATPLIPEDAIREIIQEVEEFSSVLSVSRRLPNMTRGQQRLPVSTALVTAQFLNAESDLKQTSNAEWTNRFIDAEELAVIVPVPEAVVADVDYDIWGEIRPQIMGAFGAAIDAAILFGAGAPGNWPTDILAGATAAGHAVALNASGIDLYADIMGSDAFVGVLGAVEADGYMVNGHVAGLSMKRRLRGLRDVNGQPIFLSSMQERTTYELDGAPVFFPKNGSMDEAQALLFSGDWSKLVYSIRQDMTFKILDQAVINDAAGNIVVNLAQQDMVALRAVMRLGWQLPNPVNRTNPNDATRYPFAVLTP